MFLECDPELVNVSCHYVMVMYVLKFKCVMPCMTGTCIWVIVCYQYYIFSPGWQGLLLLL